MSQVMPAKVGNACFLASTLPIENVRALDGMSNVSKHKIGMLTPLSPHNLYRIVVERDRQIFLGFILIGMNPC